MSKERINEIEMMLAHQEKQIHELNEVVTRQWGVIDSLERHLLQIQGKLEEASASGGGGHSGDTDDSFKVHLQNKPPHY